MAVLNAGKKCSSLISSKGGTPKGVLNSSNNGFFIISTYGK
jgi:hypothetical protein